MVSNRHCSGLKSMHTFNRVQSALFVVRVQVPQRFAHDQAKFDLVVHGDAARPQERAFAGEKDRRGGLQEEEGLLGPLVVELLDMVANVCWSTVSSEKARRGARIVAADAHDLLVVAEVLAEGPIAWKGLNGCARADGEVVGWGSSARRDAPRALLPDDIPCGSCF